MVTVYIAHSALGLQCNIHHTIPRACVTYIVQKWEMINRDRFH